MPTSPPLPFLSSKLNKSLAKSLDLYSKVPVALHSLGWRGKNSPQPQLVPDIASGLLPPSYITEVKLNFSKKNGSLSMENLTIISPPFSTAGTQRAMVEMSAWLKIGGDTAT